MSIVFEAPGRHVDRTLLEHGQFVVTSNSSRSSRDDVWPGLAGAWTIGERLSGHRPTPQEISQASSDFDRSSS
jgi:hypothetical protein